MSTRVSVVVPAYNNADFIERTIDSILSQTYADLEVIIADHSSTDGTWELIQRFGKDPRVSLLQTEAGGGALRNWNKVSQAATGELIKLVCGDDLIHPTLVEKQVAALRDHPSATLSACSRQVVDVSDKIIISERGLAGLSGVVAGGRALRKSVLRGTNIFGEPACVMMRRSTLEKVGWWDSTFPYLIDEATYARVLLEGDFVAIDEPLAGFRMSNSQWSVRLARSQASQARGFHRWLRRTAPTVVSSLDIWRGNAAAYIMSGLRRSAYFLLRSRMRGVEE